MSEPRVIHPDELIGGPVTPGMERLEAFAAPDRWIGRVTSASGLTSGWHYHGQHASYFYVVAGSTRLEFADGNMLQVGVGDFAHVPARAVHRESSTGPDTLEVILVRIGSGPQVVEVPDPGTTQLEVVE